MFVIQEIILLIGGQHNENKKTIQSIISGVNAFVGISAQRERLL